MYHHHTGMAWCGEQWPVNIVAWVQIICGLQFAVGSCPNILVLPLGLLKTFAGLLFVQVHWFSSYHKNQHF